MDHTVRLPVSGSVCRLPEEALRLTQISQYAAMVAVDAVTAVDYRAEWRLSGQGDHSKQRIDKILVRVTLG